MPTNYKILGQVAPVAATLTPLYTVPANTQVIESSLMICNRDIATTYRVTVHKAGAALDVKQYIAYDITAPEKDTVPLPGGLTLGPGDVVNVYAGTSFLSFNLFGAELT